MADKKDSQEDKYGGLSLGLGIAGIITSPTSLLGIIASIFGLYYAKKQEKLGETNLSKAGYVVNIIALILSILATIGILILIVFYVGIFLTILNLA